MVSVNDLQNHKTQVTSLRKYDSPHSTFTFIFCLKQKIYMHVGRHTHTHTRSSRCPLMSLTVPPFSIHASQALSASSPRPPPSPEDHLPPTVFAPSSPPPVSELPISTGLIDCNVLLTGLTSIHPTLMMLQNLLFEKRYAIFLFQAHPFNY